MKKEIITTKDGSSSIYLPLWNETYHSKFGAIQEAKHVFIKNGLSRLNLSNISILEIGFGTGLNAFITFLETLNTTQHINYTAVEAFPLEHQFIENLNYVSKLNAMQHQSVFETIHRANWGETILLSSNFSLYKSLQKFEDINYNAAFNIIYFDAFGYDVQPDLWSEEIFKKMYASLVPKGILVTYACRTIIKNNMKLAGFSVEKLPGAPGKREMLLAIK